MKTKKRAAVGGEYGANGEWYEGGKFINTVPENAKRHKIAVSAKLRKQMVTPGVWEIQPAWDAKAILQTIVGTSAQYVDRNDRNTNIKPYEPYCEVNGYGCCGYDIRELCQLYNRGIRWFYPRPTLD